MLTKYDVEVAPSLSSLFREAFGHASERMGFAAVAKLAAPGTGVWEYQRDDVIVSLHTYSAGGQKEHIVIETPSLDLTQLICASLSELITNILTTFLEPVNRAQREEIEEGLAALFTQLGMSEGH